MTEEDGYNYRFSFAWQSPYGHVVRMLDGLSPDAGIVLDLGCGWGAIAEPLRERGHEYVGCDVDKRAVDDLAARGFEAHQLDLDDRDGLPERIATIAGDRTVGAVTLLDTIEHLPDTEDFVQLLRETLLLLRRPTLVLSVPNVAHYDLGAKLLMGRWDYTPTGLLDITHVSFFTEQRLTEEFARCGLAEIARDDYRLVQSDQHFPAEHPAFVEGSPLSMLLWSLRTQADDTATVNQFIRAYALTDVLRPWGKNDGVERPFLSVLVRTQGRRMANLLEALTCLAAQGATDFEAIVLVHATTGDSVERVKALVEGFDDSFQGKCRVVHVGAGGRARPLNVGLDLARGRYLAFLDEDDHVTGDWVATFEQGAAEHPGKIVRTVCMERRAESLVGKGLVAEWQALGALEANYCEDFDLLEHLNENRTPIHSFAVPLTALRSLGLHFDESLPVVEDWDVLIRTASLTGVHDTKKRTSIYQRWVGGESSQASIDRRVWSAARQVVLHRLDNQPLLLPPGSASRLADSCYRRANEPLEPLPTPDAPADDGGRYQSLQEEHSALRDRLSRAEAELERFQTSEFWRVTAPLRRVAGVARKVNGVLARARRNGASPSK